ncbi:hypothetical protein M885DRAFT_610049 [Pelagophyceae sp. CCMP2097]|nr:hypothetical protein M885DRAFT_610049 [Pelagophyceae sp. CCMP2097]
MHRIQDALVKEVASLDEAAKAFEADAARRQEDFTAARIARCTGAQRDLVVKILAKMCGNLVIVGWRRWRQKGEVYRRQFALVNKISIMCRMINGKKHVSFRTWHRAAFQAGLDKFKFKEELRAARDALAKAPKARALQLEKLRAEAAELLALSLRNVADAAAVLAVSSAFADNLHLVPHRIRRLRRV